jgi:hypothetical protein
VSAKIGMSMHAARTWRSASIPPNMQGLTLTLVHFSAQRKHFLWDTLGTFSRYMGHNSSQTGHITAH